MENLKKLGRPFFNSFSKWYMGHTNKTLAQYGLKYEDTIIEENPDVQMALKYLPPDV